jgi:serpin B
MGVFFFQNVASGTDKNVILSPFSISTCLSLVAMGATGKTAEEIISVLKYNGLAREELAENYKTILASLSDAKSLKIANKVYLQQKYSLHPKFNELATKHFYSEAELLDFAKNVEAAKSINDWVELKTNNKIKDLIKPDLLDDLTRMVLVNAIHFKGTWVHQFDKDRTHPMPFWTSVSESVVSVFWSIQL